MSLRQFALFAFAGCSISVLSGCYSYHPHNYHGSWPQPMHMHQGGPELGAPQGAYITPSEFDNANLGIEGDIPTTGSQWESTSLAGGGGLSASRIAQGSQQSHDQNAWNGDSHEGELPRGDFTQQGKRNLTDSSGPVEYPGTTD